MLINFFKTTLRSLRKNSTHSFLNIFGLTIGIACAGLIFLWVEDELNYDGFNLKKNQLYFVRVNALLDANVFTHWSTPGVLGPAIQKDIPGIANTARASEDLTNKLFTIGDKPIYAGGKYAEASIFDMFTLQFLQGSPKTAFNQLHSLIITEKTAKKFFGWTSNQEQTKNLIGKSVRIDNKQDYVITGVIKDLPENSSLQFEWLAPFEIFYQQSPWAHVWENNCVSTYVELNSGVRPEDINKKLYNYVQDRAPTSTGHVFLFAMNDWRLYNDFENGKQTGAGRIQYVRMFSLIAWIILLIACINFMNLSTARSEKRSREVGVRKVLGAEKKWLIVQFIGEALMMSLIATIAAVLLIYLLLPAFNNLVQKETLSLGLNHPAHIIALLLISIVCGLVAGSYPSLYLSSFNPVFVLKGLKLKTGSAAMIRKGLVVLQFGISIVLIVGTIIIYQQIQHIKSRQLGFNKDNLVQISMHGDVGLHYDVLRQDLLHSGAVEQVALTDYPALYGGNNTDGLTWPGKKPGAKILVSWRDVSQNYFVTAGIPMLRGRDFNITDTINPEVQSIRANAIITESLEKLMGKGSAIGKVITNENDSLLHATVVGVVKDFVYGYMYGKPDPVIFMSTSARTETIIYARLKRGLATDQALASIESVMKKDDPACPFDYKFVDDQFNQLFESEMLMSKLSRVFASLAIIISCLGLFGLAAYTAERRTKEIGIRKVLGASVGGLARLLSADFLKMVIISCLLGFPIGWWMMHKWLLNFPYRITINGWIFLLAGGLAVIIAIITVSSQAIRAAMANPVKSLRTE